MKKVVLVLLIIAVLFYLYKRYKKKVLTFEGKSVNGVLTYEIYLDGNLEESGETSVNSGWGMGDYEMKAEKRADGKYLVSLYYKGTLLSAKIY